MYAKELISSQMSACVREPWKLSMVNLKVCPWNCGHQGVEVSTTEAWSAG
jgi:hypothetical protein